MKKQMRTLPFLPLAMAALALAVVAPANGATPFDEADIFFELNNTDGDLGIHALIDGDAWQKLTFASPDGREKLRIVTSGTLKNHGLTELFFESAEPPFDELPPARVFQRFKEGDWEISGTTIEGDELESTDRLSHVMPAPPGGITISGVPAVANCDVVPLPSVSPPVVIKWAPVTTSHPSIGKTGPIEVVRYQLVLELEELDEVAFSVNLPPDVTEFEVPADFIALGDAFKFEILVREETGNQTAIESCFEIQ